MSTTPEPHDVEKVASNEDKPAVVPKRDRSLSPMELDSPGSSTPSSPHLPTPPPRIQAKSVSFSPPGLWISTSPPKKAQEEQDENMTPLHLSPDGGDPPGLSSLPVSTQKPISTANGGASVRVAEVKQPEKPVDTSASDMDDDFMSPKASAGSKPSATPEEPAKSASPAPAAPYVPKRKVVPNPFVSGGLLTDFVGVTQRGSPTTEAPPSATRADSQSEVRLQVPTSDL